MQKQSRKYHHLLQKPRVYHEQFQKPTRLDYEDCYYQYEPAEVQYQSSSYRRSRNQLRGKYEEPMHRQYDDEPNLSYRRGQSDHQMQIYDHKNQSENRRKTRFAQPHTRDRHMNYQRPYEADGQAKAVHTQRKFAPSHKHRFQNQAFDEYSSRGTRDKYKQRVQPYEVHSQIGTRNLVSRYTSKDQPTQEYYMNTQYQHDDLDYQESYNEENWPQQDYMRSYLNVQKKQSMNVKRGARVYKAPNTAFGSVRVKNSSHYEANRSACTNSGPKNEHRNSESYWYRGALVFESPERHSADAQISIERGPDESHQNQVPVSVTKRTYFEADFGRLDSVEKDLPKSPGSELLFEREIESSQYPASIQNEDKNFVDVQDSFYEDEAVGFSEPKAYQGDGNQTLMQFKDRMQNQDRQSQSSNQEQSEVLNQQSSRKVQLPTQKRYRRRQPALKPDQPLPIPPDEDSAKGLQHAFRSSGEIQEGETGFDFCQISHVAASSKDEPDILNLLGNVSIQPLMASAGKAACARPADLALTPAAQQAKLAGLNGDDSDGCDFDEIENEIHDTLMRRSVSSDEEQVVRASQRSPTSPQQPKGKRLQSPQMIEVVEASSSQAQQKPHINQTETKSTVDSSQEQHQNEGVSPQGSGKIQAWCVSMPSETVLHLDSLPDFLEEFGKVLATLDINESIQVQYADQESAIKLCQALYKMQIGASMTRLNSPRGCQSAKKKLFEDPDAELTLKLLKITPQLNGLQVQRTDSEFMKDYNNTAQQQIQSASNVIISTDGSAESDTNNDHPPTLEQATNFMGKESSFLLAPSFIPYASGQPSGSEVAGVGQKQQESQVLLHESMMMRSTVFSLDHGLTVPTEGSYFEDQHLSQICLTTEAPYGNQVPTASISQQPHSNATTSQEPIFASSGVSQNSYENQSSQFAAGQQHDEQLNFVQCFNDGNSVPQPQFQPRLKNPFSCQAESAQSMIMPTGTTFYPTNTGCQGLSSQATSQHNKHTDPQFIVDLDRILHGEDHRTTIMIRHIPNKYTEDMLLERINRKHDGRFDFFYLPLDLNNGCNIGYAFINFVDPVYIVPFYEDMDNQSWETFNSEKICEITYGRIQGKRNLVENVNKQPETRKIKPLILSVPFNLSHIEMMRNEYIAARQQQQFINVGTPTMTTDAPEFQQTQQPINSVTRFGGPQQHHSSNGKRNQPRQSQNTCAAPNQQPQRQQLFH